jgi:hypothetical protein
MMNSERIQYQVLAMSRRVRGCVMSRLVLAGASRDRNDTVSFIKLSRRSRKLANVDKTLQRL